MVTKEVSSGTKFSEQPHRGDDINRYKKSSIEITRATHCKPKREILMDEKCIKKEDSYEQT